MKRAIGKNTLGGGNKMNVDLKTYNRSTHNLSYAWRSSMSVGTLTPFMKLLALPGDTFDINLDAKIFTHPTIGPLFGSYKIQWDVFTCPMRLYMAPLHNNALGVGLDMSKVKIPQLKPDKTIARDVTIDGGAIEERQISPSCVLNYLGYGRGWSGVGNTQPEHNAIPLLAYLDIFKNYYANKQEDKFYAIQGGHNRITDYTNNLTFSDNLTITGGSLVFTEKPPVTTTVVLGLPKPIGYKEVRYSLYDTKYFTTTNNLTFTAVANVMRGFINFITNGEATSITDYDLNEIDEIREHILSKGFQQVVFENITANPSQYLKDILARGDNGRYNASTPMSGLILKTHQSDLFNNWINTEWIDGENGINAITAIDTSSGSFSIDTLNLSKKVYDMLNRIAISGGTYKDWIDTVYTSGYELHAETPIYEGGMSNTIEFDQVVSNSATDEEPLGSLAGRGVLGENKKGGNLHIKIKEPSYIIGIVSITPYVDYAQTRDFDITFETMNDLHKPALDGIGFQDLIATKFAWWMNSKVSIGKQPAWIDYMTNVNKVYGNFAIEGNESFMCLIKWFEMEKQENGQIDTMNIKNSTYIDPEQYQYTFADTDLTAQNFWVQTGVGIEARRVMSAKQIPNL